MTKAEALKFVTCLFDYPVLHDEGHLGSLHALMDFIHDKPASSYNPPKQCDIELKISMNYKPEY